MTETAAERFYKDSHERNTGGAPIPMLAREQAAPELLGSAHRYRCVFEHLQSDPGKTVVELGFGSPRLLAALAHGCASYTIVDILDRTSAADLPANVTFRQADLSCDFPFADARFDCAVAMMIVEHLFDPFHSFRELARITTPGGKVFVNLPNIASIRCRLELLAGRMPVTSSRDWFEKREWDGNHLHYFTVADTIRLAAISGLRLEAIHPVGKWSGIKRLRPSLLCHEISYQFCRE
jgi:SAM-dependent methyltransferase